MPLVYIRFMLESGNRGRLANYDGPILAWMHLEIGIGLKVQTTFAIKGGSTGRHTVEKKSTVGMRNGHRYLVYSLYMPEGEKDKIFDGTGALGRQYPYCDIPGITGAQICNRNPLNAVGTPDFSLYEMYDLGINGVPSATIKVRYTGSWGGTCGANNGLIRDMCLCFGNLVTNTKPGCFTFKDSATAVLASRVLSMRKFGLEVIMGIQKIQIATLPFLTPETMVKELYYFNKVDTVLTLWKIKNNVGGGSGGDCGDLAKELDLVYDRDDVEPDPREEEAIISKESKLAKVAATVASVLVKTEEREGWKPKWQRPILDTNIQTGFKKNEYVGYFSSLIDDENLAKDTKRHEESLLCTLTEVGDDRTRLTTITVDTPMDLQRNCKTGALRVRNTKWMVADGNACLLASSGPVKVRVVKIFDSTRIQISLRRHPGYDVSSLLGESIHFIEEEDVSSSRQQAALRSIEEKLTAQSHTRLLKAWWGDQVSAIDPIVQTASTASNQKRGPTTRRQLNPKQEEAVEAVLSKKFPVVLCQGPYGTGKSHTIQQLVRDLIALDGPKSILLTAPSNVATDNLLASISDLEPVRVGQVPGDKELAKYHVEALVDKALEGRQKKESEEERESERRATRNSVFRYSKLVVTTCVGAGHRCFDGLEYDVVVIDEAGQATEGEALIPLNRVKPGRGVMFLAGDHFQLPPNIANKETEKRKQMEMSPLERLTVRGNSKYIHLDEQHRCHSFVSNFASTLFYGGLVRTVCMDKDRTFEGNEQLPDWMKPVLCFRDIPFGKMYQPANSPSKANMEEAQAVVEACEKLTAAGAKPQEILILSLYEGQVRLLRSLIKEKGIKIATVDWSQGEGKDFVLATTVRTEDGFGFLNQWRRINLMLTRTKKKFIFFGKRDHLIKSTIWADLITYAEAKGKRM